MKNYEVIAPFGIVVKTGITKEYARKIVRKAWRENQRVLYWREIGSEKFFL